MEPSRLFLLHLPEEMLAEITTYLGIKTLLHFALTCRRLTATAIRTLYRRNSIENSTAIQWAVRRAERTGEELHEYTVSIATLRYARRYAGDINAKHYFPTTNPGCGCCFPGQAAEGQTPPPGPHPVETDERKMTPISYAASENRVKVVKWLLRAGADPSVLDEGLGDRHFGTVLTWIDRVSTSLGIGLQLRGARWAPLLLPFCAGHRTVVCDLIGAGASSVVAVLPGRLDLRLLHLAAADDSMSLGRKLIRKFPADINAAAYIKNKRDLGAETPLCIATKNNNQGMVFKLLEAGADPNLPDVQDLPPIFRAIQSVHTAANSQERMACQAIIQSLIHHGADVNYQANYITDVTPLIMAVTPTEWTPTTVWKDMKSVVQMLIEHGAQVNQAAADGCTPLHHLCKAILSKGNNPSLLKLVDYLVKIGGDVNIPFPDGSSTIHRVIYRFQRRPWGLLKLLINEGAMVQPREADLILYFWIRQHRQRSSSNMDWAPIKRLVSQRAVDEAYAYAAEQKSKDKRDKLFERLDNIFPEAQSGQCRE